MNQRRYEEPKLNLKKVFAVALAFVVIIMFIVLITGTLTKDKKQGKITSIDYFVSFKDNKWGVIDSNRKHHNRPKLWRNDNYSKQQKRRIFMYLWRKLRNRRIQNQSIKQQKPRNINRIRTNRRHIKQRQKQQHMVWRRIKSKKRRKIWINQSITEKN